MDTKSITNGEMERFSISVDNIPGTESAVLFSPMASDVFREQGEISPLTISDRVTIMPWGGDNLMPYNIIDRVERDETLQTCMKFATETLYGSGLSYTPASESVNPNHLAAAEEFCQRNNLSAYFLGVAYDFRYFGMAVSVIILSKDQREIVSIRRKPACYCRFAPADPSGRIREIHFTNWRVTAPLLEERIESIPLLDEYDPLGDLQTRMASGDRGRKFAVVSRIPTVDSTYYPIPHYASLFRSGWYDIKQLIGVAKKAKLRNAAPIKYHIQISDKYWQTEFRERGLTSPEKQRAFMVRMKNEMIEFLTSAENSGKVLFSSYYVTPDGHENKDVLITKIDTVAQGGDWKTEIQEAVNMICFTMGVHSNLVGSVPGSSQVNNSGSDKRELYTIAQATQKPYRDILFEVHRLIIDYNGWEGMRPVCPFIQLTTLDEHADARQVTL